MKCSHCQKRTICQYGLVNVPSKPDDDLLIFCTQECLDAYRHQHGYFTAMERRIVELEKEVEELRAKLKTATEK